MKSGQINSFSLAEIFPVGDSFFHRFAAINGQVGKPPQTLRHTQRFRSNRLCVMSRNAIMRGLTSNYACAESNAFIPVFYRQRSRRR